jgi:hypothetical protein
VKGTGTEFIGHLKGCCDKGNDVRAEIGGENIILRFEESLGSRTCKDRRKVLGVGQKCRGGKCNRMSGNEHYE